MTQITQPIQLEADVTQPPPLLSGGLPLLGHAVPFALNRLGLFLRGAREHGSIFQIQLGLQKVAVVIGPDHQKTFFTETDKRLNIQKPYTFLRAMFGEALFLAPHDVYLEQRPAVTQLFKRHKMVEYIQIMQEVVQAWLDQLPDEGEIEMNAEMIWLAKEIAGLSFLGETVHRQVGPEFWGLYDELQKALDPLLPSHWPLPKFKRRDRARARMEEIMLPIIEERRSNPDAYEDQLQTVVDKLCESDHPFEAMDVLNLLLGLMFAGHETTAGQGAWNLILLAQHPAYLKLVQQEIAETTTRGEWFDHRAMAQQKHILWAVREVERLYPSADTLMRFVDQPTRFGDYEVPAGWLVQTAAEVAHRMPELWTNPDRYDPLRFAPGREEDKKDRFSTIGFGGGLHKCTGMNFANNEMMIVATLLFQQFDCELIDPEPTILRGLGANRPTPTRMRIRRRS